MYPRMYQQVHLRCQEKLLTSGICETTLLLVLHSTEQEKPSAVRPAEGHQHQGMGHRGTKRSCKKQVCPDEKNRIIKGTISASSAILLDSSLTGKVRDKGHKVAFGNSDQK